MTRMAYEDSDEGDTVVPEVITDYRFVDENDDPVFFSNLPLKFDEEGPIGGENVKVFIRGKFDDGLQKIYKQIVAWKVEFDDEEVGLFVLSKDGNWFRIIKPRKSYQEIVRGVFVSLECLFYLKRNPDSKERRLWDHVGRKFSNFEVSPGRDDLMLDQPFARCIVDRDKGILRAEGFSKLMKGPSKKKSSPLDGAEDSHNDEKEDDVTSEKSNGDDGSDLDLDDDGYDPVCVICDNGGDLLCCEGECLRSFHATKSAGAESQCKSLGYTRAQVKAIKNFFCPNCLHKKHQCFACGKLGNSDKESGPEVFRCMSVTCGRFYHPACVAKLLSPEKGIDAAALEEKIIAGGSFMCPVHQCMVCDGVEDKKVEELQFAICRRCPTAYHRKCLPSEIALEESDDEGEQRAWDDLIPNRILIYCLKHKIDSNIGTPKRNHIVFPQMVEEKSVASVDTGKKKVNRKRKAEVFPSEDENPNKLSRPSEERDKPVKFRKPAQRSNAQQSSTLRGITSDSTEKQVTDDEEMLEPKIDADKLGDEMSKVDSSVEKKKLDRKASSLHEDGKKRKKRKVDGSRHTPEVARQAEISSIEKEKKPRNSVKMQFSRPSKGLKDLASLERRLSSKDENVVNSVPEDWMETSMDVVASSVKEPSSPVTSINEDARKRILLLVEKVPSSFKEKDSLRKKQFSGGSHYQMKNIVNKIAQGKVEGSVRAIRTALHKYESGGTIEDAKAICGPDIVNQIVVWKEKLRTYLGPFLRGVHDSSYGQDIKEMNKLEEIIGRLHWYLENDDMIIDVCCGMKHFINLMSKKLELMGKKCSFKSFDIFAPKNDTTFQKKDWLAINPKELQFGSEAVIRLVLPRGVNASFARRLISKAIAYNPKLLLLDSPRSLESLAAQPEAYDLVWEDEQKTIGQANSPRSPVKPFFLYLWSRPDWTPKHQDIAMKHDHKSGKPTTQNTEDEDVDEYTNLQERKMGFEAHEYQKTMDHADARRSSERGKHEQRQENRFSSPETYEKAKTSPRLLDTALPVDQDHDYPHRIARDEDSPKPSGSGVAQMKYHWSCLYGLDEEPEPMKRSTRSEITPPTLTRKPPSRDTSPGERTGMRYQRTDLYGQDERENQRSSEVILKPATRDASPGERTGMRYREEREDRRPSEVMTSFPTNHRPPMYPGPSDQRPWISPSFHDQLYDRHMMDSARERDRHMWVSSERSYLSPSHGYDGRSPVGPPVMPGYHSDDFGPAHWMDPAVDHARMMYERRMWETSERIVSPRVLPRGRRRGMYDADRHPYV